MAQESLSPEDRALFQTEEESRRQQELLQDDQAEVVAHGVDQPLGDGPSPGIDRYGDAPRPTTMLGDEPPVTRRRIKIAPELLVMGIVLLGVVLVFAAIARFRSPANATERIPQPRLAAKSVLATPSADTGMAAGQQTDLSTAGSPAANAVGGEPAATTEVDPLFADYYATHNGPTLFGKPWSPLLSEDGRQVQWFERTRLEHFPEHAGTPYEIQPALVGREYTAGRDFPQQIAFDDRPGLVYFPATSHGLRGPFLDFWNANGGVDIFGYPISDELVEVIETGRLRRVQYFERARMELHPVPGTADYQVLLGRLGAALLADEPRPEPLPVPAPTPVPPQ